jgi:hypothetical protein
MTLLVAACFGVWAVGHLLGGGSWADTWMPNFIAEWSGIFIAVVVVERLFERDRRRQQELALAPLRRAAGSALLRALSSVLDYAVREYAEVHQTKREDAIPASVFLNRWADEVEQHPTMTDPFWLDWLSDALAGMATQLREVRARYITALEPREIANLDSLERQASSFSHTAKGVADQLDPDTPTPRKLPLVLRDDQVPGIIGMECKHLTIYFSFVARHYFDMTGETFTTERAWETNDFLSQLTELAGREEARRINAGMEAR